MKNGKKIENIEKIIIIMIVVICVLSMVYFLIIKNLDQNVNDFINNNTPTDTTPIELQKDIQEVKTRDMYYVMKNITKRYFLNILKNIMKIHIIQK